MITTSKAATIFAAAVLLTACTTTSGSGSTGSRPPSTDVTTPTVGTVTTSPVTTPPVDPAVKARASLLLATDLPSNWGGFASDASTTYTGLSDRLRACVGSGVAGADPISVRTSFGFSRLNESADSATSVFADDRAVSVVVAALGTSAFRRCYRAQILRSLSKTFGRTPVRVDPVSVSAKRGARSGIVATALVRFGYTINGIAGNQFVDVTFVAGPRFLTGVAIGKAGSRAPAALRKAAVAAVVRRAAG